MSIKIRIPGALRTLTQNQAIVSSKLSSGTVKDILSDLDGQYPGFNKRLYDDAGTLRKFINIYLDEEDIRFLKALDTEVADGSELSIVPAVAGG